MQLGNGLQNAWMMFDHIKHVQGWTTITYHVYDLVYCKVVTITVYNMQSEDIEVQCILWKKLNVVVKKKGLCMLVFKGFMMDGAQVNWNVIHIVYGIEDLIIKMVDKE
jgi:hypothetical protein